MALINKKDDYTGMALVGRTGANGYAVHFGSPWTGKDIVRGKYPIETGGVVDMGMVQCPMKLGTGNGEMWQLPLDPMISVQGKNIVTRRYVSKGDRRGSVKELWSMDDWDVEINGVLIAETDDEMQSMMAELRKIITHPGAIQVECEVMGWYDIQKLVVDSYDFPHTKGMLTQTYKLKCYSDEDYNLLEEV